MKVQTDGFGFNLDAVIYEGELGNFYSEPELEFPTFGTTGEGIFTLTYEPSEEISLDGGTDGKTYWLAFTAADGQTDEINWVAYDYDDGGDGNEPMYYSTNGGESWTSDIDGVDGLAEGIIDITATCEESEDSGGGDEPEDFDCSQGIASNDFESAADISDAFDLRSRAVDLLVGMQQD